jgi:hypothetical protein
VLVGNMFNSEYTTQYHAFDIDDGTGRVKAFLWTNDEVGNKLADTPEFYKL